MVIKTKFNKVIANSILNSGAGVSIMDLGTFESLQLEQCLQKSNDTLQDASGNQMDILGIALIKVEIILHMRKTQV